MQILYLYWPWSCDSMQHNHLPRCKLQVTWHKTAIGQAEQDPNLPCLASNVLGFVYQSVGASATSIFVMYLRSEHLKQYKENCGL